MSNSPAISLVINRILSLKIFRRNKVPFKNKVYGCLLYYLGLSYRNVAELFGVSHIAVRKWWKKLKEIFPEPKAKRRKHVAVDETKIKLNSSQIFVWAAIDCETKELLALRASKGRSTADAYFFLRKVKNHCKGKTICHVDGGPWYLWAVEKTGFVYRRTVGGLRNAAEHFFSILKERTKRFWNIFRSWEGIDCFMDVFRGFYNLWRR